MSGFFIWKRTIDPIMDDVAFAMKATDHIELVGQQAGVPRLSFMMKAAKFNAFPNIKGLTIGSAQNVDIVRMMIAQTGAHADCIEQIAHRSSPSATI
ncbi:hypothetical protein SxD43FB_20520 [Sphingobium sp. D43FB]|nr:hypothetical protein SxD43FB_20520 [Sphingobium sp. D43FB]